MRQKLILLLTVMFSIGVLFASCKNSEGDNVEEVQSSEQLSQDSSVIEEGVREVAEQEVVGDVSSEFNSAYICPNHCEGSGAEEEGDCPKCGMEYIENLNTH